MASGVLTRFRLVLDPIERVSEVVFGVLMALSFTGTLSVATAGREEIRTLLFTALGCNVAWGLTDAVMYLVGTATERRRKVGLLQRLHEARDKAEAHRLIADLTEKLGRTPLKRLEQMIDYDEDQAAAILKQWMRGAERA
jgi:hypothetical protein